MRGDKEKAASHKTNPFQSPHYGDQKKTPREIHWAWNWVVPLLLI